MRYVSSGLDGSVWGVGEDEKAYYRTGIVEGDKPFGTGWTESVGVSLKQLEAGNCQVYGVDKLHQIFRLTGCQSNSPEGTGWESVGGTLRHIAVG